jgi:hypothetical protein
MTKPAFLERGKTALRETKGERLADLSRLRETAIEIVKNNGKFKPVRCGDKQVPVMSAKRGDFSLMYSTPFQRISNSAPDYMLDVWHSGENKKVLSLHWNENEPAMVVAFKRGDWERALLTQTEDNTRQQAA